MILFIPDTLDRPEKELLGELFDKYGKKMFSAAKKIVGNTADAEDAVQNAFVCAAKCLSKLERLDDDSVKGYLLTMAKNEAVNVIRHADKSVPYGELPAEADPFADVNARVCDREVYEKIISIMHGMDEIYKAPLYLTCVMGMTVKETAAQLHRNEQTVKGQIARGKKMIISQLKEAGYELS